AGEATRRFEAAMDDDFNTPDAIAAMQWLASEINRAKAAADLKEAGELAAELRSLGSVLGILQLDPAAFLKLAVVHEDQDAGSALSDIEIERLIAARVQARKSRDFKESDRIRDQLTEARIILEDKPNGTTAWRRG
ncbi:MAG: DALR domain-containing protein, partial [Gemmatimonadaceae bacterium]